MDATAVGVTCRASPPDVARCAPRDSLGSTYPYLLGIYLGDGMLSAGRRGVWCLRISLDAKYPGVIARVGEAIGEVVSRRVGHVPRPGCVEITCYWKHWPCLFPQHGRGPKHERHIVLADWQTQLVSRYPEEFVAGLIHSDGCRCVNRVKGHEYPRYFFSNRSAEIRALFVVACTMLGIESRPAGPRNISVARRDSVALLDELVGSKH